ncbi:MAG: FtsX-like permease family protein [Candidatus Babeliaceae bacterium]|nr:FtsX-like permease family protein [Candidatus Babeliaceae bacterium]
MIDIVIRLAFAQITHGSGQKNISFMVKLCFIALTISTFALTLVVAVMNGFQKETAKKLQGIHADIIIKSPTGALDYQRLATVIEKEFAYEIIASAPQAISNILLKSDNHETFSPLCVCIGIEPVCEKKVSTLFSTLTNSSNQLEQIAGNNLLIGVTAAKLLHILPKDPVTALYIPEEPQKRKITLEQTAASVGGTFKTGIDEFDTAVVFCNLEFFKKLFRQSDVSQLTLKCNSEIDIESCARKLQARFNSLEIYTWKDLYPALVAALSLEKYAAFIILALCSLIAAMNCMALIFMYITQKKMEIVILKTMGMLDRDISMVFMFIGLLITIAATTTGITLAAAGSWLLKNYPIIKLPDAYYVDHIPAALDIPIILAVFCTMMLLGFVASYIPSRRIHVFSVAYLLKFGAE